MIHSRVMGECQDTPKNSKNVENSMGRSYERLKADYIRRKQGKQGRSQSPPITPMTDITRMHTQVESQNYDDEENRQTSVDDSSSQGRAAEFVFPTRHFVANADV